MTLQIIAFGAGGETVSAYTNAVPGSNSDMTDQWQLNVQLIQAAGNGLVNQAREAIEQGADVNNKGGDTLLQGTPLSEAVRRPGCDMVRLLLDAGATPTGSGWCTPVIDAARYSNTEALKLLVGTGEVDAQMLGSALAEAAHNRKRAATEMVSYLIRAGAPINDTRALLKAAEVDNIEVIDLLIDNGCDLERFGAGALEVACRHGFYETAEHLLQAGVDAASGNYRALYSALSAWKYAESNALPCEEYEPTVLTLITAVALSEHALAERQYHEMMVITAKHGRGDILTKQMLSRLPSQKDLEIVMRWAARSGNTQTLSSCLELGANPRAQKSKALVWACQAGEQDCARLLVNTGAISELVRTQLSDDAALETLEASTPITLIRDNAGSQTPESLFF